MKVDMIGSSLPFADFEAGANKEIRHHIRMGRWVLLAAGLLFIGFFALAQIEGAVVGSGIVKVDLNRKVVQHQEGGIVREVKVRDGQKVAAGEVLLELADVAVDAGAESSRTQFDAELLRSVRLTAEQSIAAELVVPESLRQRADQTRFVDLLAHEKGLFAARRDTLDSQLRLLNQQTREVEREASALKHEMAAEQAAMTLQKEELTQNEALVRQGFVQRSRMIPVERAVHEYSVRYAEHEAELARARQKLNDLKLRRLALRNDYVETANRELRESNARLQELEQRLRPSEDAAKRQRILSPVAGEVVGLKITTAGSVIGPRELLMEIVPKDARLVVEGRIRPQDITHVRVGTSAFLHLTAFGSRETPRVECEVEHVSADVTSDTANGAMFYVVRMSVSADSLKKAGDVYLQAGMPVEFFVRTERRSIASYVLEPVTSFLRRGLRES